MREIWNKIYKNRHLKTALKLCVSVLFIWYLLHRTDPGLVWENVRHYPPVPLLGAFVLMMADCWIAAVSLHALYGQESTAGIFIVTLKSCFYSLMLPGQLLGESAKILLLPAESGSISQRASAVLIDKALNVAALFWLGALGIFISDDYPDSGLRIFFGTMAAGVTAFLMFSMSSAFCACAGRLIKKIKKGRIRDAADKYWGIWAGYAENKKGVLVSASCGAIYHLLINFMYCILASGFSMHISPWDFCWVNALLTLILLLPVSVGGLGIRETSLAGLLGLLGVNADAAFSFSILILLLQVMRASVGGLLVLSGRTGRK